jgi:uncharacterized protein (DUF849 family)
MGGVRIERIKVCLNGGRRPHEHPAMPVSPAHLAVAAAASVAAGAEAVHMHPRDQAGGESLAVADIGAAVAEVRRYCPGVPIGVSTRLPIAGGDPAARLAAVVDWQRLSASERPDFASANVGEPGFVPLTRTLLDAGIAVEAGVWSLTDAETLAGSGLINRLLWTLVEVMGGSVRQAGGTAMEILARLDALEVPGPRLLHGEGPPTWPLVLLAGRLGLPTRIGFEDVLTGPSGEPVADNAELVQLALAEWRRGSAER